MSLQAKKTKQANQEPRSGSDFSRALLDDFPTPAWRSGTDGLCDYFNSAWLEFTGRSFEMELGDGWISGVHPDDVERVMIEYQAAFDRRESFTLEYRLQRCDGVYRHFVDHGRPYNDLHGNFAGYIGSCYDITERIEAEEALRESELHHRLLIEALPVAMYTCDSEGRVTLYNDAATKLWGQRPQIGKNAWCGSWRIYNKDGSLMSHDGCPMAVAIQQGRSVRGIEIIIERPDGTRSHVLPHPSPIRNSSGTIIGAVNMVVDLTDRIEAEEVLRESETRFRQLAENIDKVFWLCNPEWTRIDYVSPAYENVWGRTCESLYQAPRSWLDSIHPEDRERVSLAAVHHGPPVRYDQTYRIVRADGSVRWICARGFSVCDAEGKLVRVAGIAEDITKMQQANDAIRENERERAEAHNKLQLLSRRLLHVQEDERRTIAYELHDGIGQTLSAVKIGLQTAQNSDGAITQRQLADSITLVDQLLQQVRQLALDLRPSILDHLGLVAALRWYFDQQRQRSGLIIDFRYFDLPATIPGEIQTACYRIAQEAQTNVLRHANAQHVRVELRELNGMLIFTLTDDGVGFDFEQTKSRASLGVLTTI